MVSTPVLEAPPFKGSQVLVDLRDLTPNQPLHTTRLSNTPSLPLTPRASRAPNLLREGILGSGGQPDT